jgi:Xaa-Pro aminopeptidase
VGVVIVQQNGRLELKGDFCMPTVDEAVQWVCEHVGLITDKAIEYRRYTPYDVDDYIQDAYHAAVEAALCCQRNPTLKFGAAFWTIFKRFVAKVTPLPDSARSEISKKKNIGADNQITSNEVKPAKTSYSGGTSMSFPRASQIDVSLERLKVRQKNIRVDINKLVESVKPLWSPRELEAMKLALGLTSEGCMSIPEIAKKMGVGKYSAREFVGRALKKCQSALKIDPPSASKIDPPQSVFSVVDPRSDSPAIVSSFHDLAVMSHPV